LCFRSWGCGKEGDTDDAEVLALRRRQQRNLLATLLLSQGTPMLAGGDEIGRTQRGNNNAYCQDGEIAWFDWELDDERRALLAFTRRLIALRREHPGLRRAKFFRGRRIRGSGVRDIMWMRHDGAEMTEEDWENAQTQSLGMFLAGKGIDDVDEEGTPIVDDDLLVLVNASHVPVDFTLPAFPGGGPWELLLDTADDAARGTWTPGDPTPLVPRSTKFFRRTVAGG
jgi:glycogen operon protein